MKNIPTRLREAREKAGIPISRMSVLMGTSRGRIYSLEKYTGIPPKIDLADVESYAKLTNTAVSALLLGIDPNLASQLISARLYELYEVIGRAKATTEKEIARLIDNNLSHR